MNAPKRILAATDLSAPARHALERAYFLAAQTGDELHIIHAMELDMLDSLHELLGANLSPAKAALEANARKELEQFAANPAHHRGVAAHMRFITE